MTNRYFVDRRCFIGQKENNSKTVRLDKRKNAFLLQRFSVDNRSAMVTVITTDDEFSTPQNNGSAEVERKIFNFKDFQEVDFHLSPSCKVFPQDFSNKSEIQGEFFVQIDEIRPINNSNLFVLILTDGIQTVRAVTIDEIPNLNENVKTGCKLFISGVVPIENGFFQLKNANTKFYFGSRTFPRPRASHRDNGRVFQGRTSFSGRRTSSGTNENLGETNFFKGPPPKNTLMDFMTTLNISRDTKSTNDEEKRRNLSNEPVISAESTDASDDDPSQTNFRERRNPLPPRLQRVQEERSRRNTGRQFDEINVDASCGATQQTFSSSSTSQTDRNYFPPGDQRGFYSPQAPPTYVTYFPTNSGQYVYSNEHLAFPYGNPYGPVTYLQATPTIPSGYVDVESTALPDENESQMGKRWKINELCYARWSEDQQFYLANILEIHPPFVTVIFLDYDNCERVHFNDLQCLTSEDEQQMTNVDQFIVMPEPPPFPFNSAGTIHLYPTTIPILSRSNRSTMNSHRVHENGPTTTNSTETSVNDSSTTSNDVDKSR